MRIHTVIGLITIAIAMQLQGCCTTTSTDPKAVGWCDLVGPGRQRLDNHLAERRAELARVQEHAAQLESRLAQKEKALEKAAVDVRGAKQESARLDNQKQQLLKEIEANKTKLASAQRNLEQLQSQASQLEANLQDTVASQQQQQQITAQIGGLEREIATLERTIDDLLAIQAKNAVMN